MKNVKYLSLIIILGFLIGCNNQKKSPNTNNSSEDVKRIQNLHQESDRLQFDYPDSALAIQKQLKEIYKIRGNKSGIINCYSSSCGIYCIYKKDIKNGKLYADSALVFAEKIANKHLLYKAYYSYGIYYSCTDNVDSAIYYFLKALKIPPNQMDENFNVNTNSQLADLFASQGNFTSAFRYYELLIEKAKREPENLNSVVIFLGAFALGIEVPNNDSVAFSYLQLAKKTAKNLNYTALNAALYHYYAEYYYKHQAMDSTIAYEQKAIETMETHPQAFDRWEKAYTMMLSSLCHKGLYLDAANTLQKAKLKIDTNIIIIEDKIKLLELEYEINSAVGKSNEAFENLKGLNKLQKEHFSNLKNDQLLKHEKELKKLAAETTILKKDAQIKKQKTFNYILIGASILLAFLFAFIILELKRRRKIKEIKMTKELQEKELQKEKELVKVQIDERNRISQEMHDDLGSTLTTVQLGLNLLQNEPSKAEYLQIIDKATNTLSFQINEAIWNLNVKNDTLYSLVGYFEAYAKEFLVNTNITLHLNQDKITKDLALTGITRRNLYLSLKELLNNTVKYAQAKNVFVDFECNEKNLTIKVKDDGIGFDAATIQPLIGKGNGLSNVKKNISLINGAIEWKSNKGTEVIIQLPLN